jgi:hypothetical protein
MAALRSAAADREREHKGFGALAATPSAAAAAAAQDGGNRNAVPIPVAAAAAAAAAQAAAAGAAAAAAAAAAVPGNPVFLERLWERLAAWYESGLVVQLPFLSAAHAAPLGLLRPVYQPCSVACNGQTPFTVQGLDPEAHALLLDLVAGGADALCRPWISSANRAGGHSSKQSFFSAGSQDSLLGANNNNNNNTAFKASPSNRAMSWHHGQQQQQPGTGAKLRPARQPIRQGFGAPQGLVGSRLPGAAGSPSSRREESAGVINSRARDLDGLPDLDPQRQQQQEEQQQRQLLLPPQVVQKALDNPAVQNLARSLAYHR